VSVKNIETGETVEYVSQSAAAKALGVCHQAISNCLKSQKLLKQTYIISAKSSD
jgi:predicted transcriptional regulator